MNSQIASYFREIEIKLKQSPVVANFELIRKEITDTDGKIRVKLTLTNKDLAELFEYVESDNNLINIKKYHFHWQDENNNLKRRWDNAPHLKNLKNFPHHVHFPKIVKGSTKVPNIFYVIGIIEVEIQNE